MIASMDREEIKKIRTMLGLTQQEFSSKIPISIVTISKWENGHSSPSKLAILRIKQLESGIA